MCAPVVLSSSSPSLYFHFTHCVWSCSTWMWVLNWFRHIHYCKCLQTLQLFMPSVRQDKATRCLFRSRLQLVLWKNAHLARRCSATKHCPVQKSDKHPSLQGDQNNIWLFATFYERKFRYGQMIVLSSHLSSLDSGSCDDSYYCEWNSGGVLADATGLYF